MAEFYLTANEFFATLWSKSLEKNTQNIQNSKTK